MTRRPDADYIPVRESGEVELSRAAVLCIEIILKEY
jgi:hypothetical protein